MQVYQVNKLYHPVVGGVESAVRALALGLRERSVDARVLAATRRGRGVRERVEGVPVTRTASLGTALSVPLAPTFPLHLRHVAREADLLHYHLPNPLAVASYVLAGRPATPSVVTYHSDIVRQSRALAIYRPLLERFLDDADHIITTSPRLRDNSEFLRPRAGDCTVVPLGIDPPDEGDQNSENETADGDGEAGSADAGGVALDAVDGEEAVVLFVGRLNYYKGVEYLLDAMVDVDATLLVVGDGDRRNALKRRAHERDLENVVFLGAVDDATLQACYERADVFALPSVEPSEAFGIVQLEAMAHGLPVVNTDLPTGVPWVSRHGETGLTVPPRDADAMAEALGALLADPGRRDRYGENARQRVRTTFTRDRMVEDTLSVYERVLDRPESERS